MDLEDRTSALLSLLAGLDGVLVAFSGGVDSSVLLWAAREALADRVLAVTVTSPAMPPGEEAEARSLAHALGVRHQVQVGDELDDPDYRRNPEDRCYFCKRRLFARLLGVAREQGLAAVVEGSQTDDLQDIRPGFVALAELGIRSPLLEVGLDKASIRTLAREQGLPVWNRPPLACLASRIPFGTPITPEALARIGAAESVVARFLDGGPLRVRDHGTLARVEVGSADIARLAAPRIRDALVEALVPLGYRYVTLDLAGYRTGSLHDRRGSREKG